MIDSVLLVDDDELIHFIHSRLLKEMKICKTIYTALNGQEALDMLRSENPINPSVIFLDVNMPGINGYNFLEEYAKVEEWKGLRPIVILTTSENEKDRAIFTSRPEVHCYLNKPLKEEEVLQIFKECSLIDDKDNSFGHALF